MANFLKLLFVVVIAFIVPFGVILGIYFFVDYKTADVIQSYISMFYVISAIVVVVGGYLMLMYQDITTGRYSKSQYRD